MKIAPSLHRLGTASVINSYLVEDAGLVTIIDAGLPGHWRLLEPELGGHPLCIDRFGHGENLTHPGHAEHTFVRPERLTSGRDFVQHLGSAKVE